MFTSSRSGARDEARPVQDLETQAGERRPGDAGVLLQAKGAGAIGATRQEAVKNTTPAARYRLYPGSGAHIRHTPLNQDISKHTEGIDRDTETSHRDTAPQHITGQ